MLLIYGAKPRKIFIFQLLHMPGNNIYRMFRILTTGKFKKFLKTFWKLGNSWKFRRNHIHVTLTSHGTRNEWMTISFVKNYSLRNFFFEKFQQLVSGKIDILVKIQTELTTLNIPWNQKWLNIFCEKLFS